MATDKDPKQDQLGKLIEANAWRLRIPQKGVRTDVPPPPVAEPPRD